MLNNRFVENSGVENSGVENSGVENSGGKNPVWGIHRGGKSVCGIFQGGIFSVGKIPGRKKIGGEYSWCGIFRGGINRGGNFRGEFSGGEIAGHRFCCYGHCDPSQLMRFHEYFDSRYWSYSC